MAGGITDELEFTVKDGENTQLIPMVWTKYNETNPDDNTSENWFQTMAIASVVWHGNYLYKLRMPHVGDKIKNNLDITLPTKSAELMVEGKYEPVTGDDIGEYAPDGKFSDGTPKYKRSSTGKFKYIKPHPAKNSFRYKVPNIINYKNTKVQQPGYRPVYNNEEEKTKDKDTKYKMNVDYLSPSYDAKKLKYYNMGKGKKDISLKCFAFDLNNSAHFLTYIGGDWFITISNPFKFFAEDMRMVDEFRIANIIKHIDEESNKLRFYVAREHVDAVLLEVYPFWKTYNDYRRNYIPASVSFFDIDEIWKIICDHMGVTAKGKAIPNRQSPYRVETQREKKAVEFRKKLKKNYYRFVSLRPVWNTEERFNNFFAGLEGYPPGQSGKVKDLLSPEIIRNKIPQTSGQSKDGQKKKKKRRSVAEIKAKEATPKTTSKVFLYESVNYEQLYNWMDMQWDEVVSYLESDTGKVEAGTFDSIVDGKKTLDTTLNDFKWKHITAILGKLNILTEDYGDIYNRLYDKTDGLQQVTIADLQETMINRANSVPGKFELFKNIVLGTGIKTSDKDPKKELDRVQMLLSEKEHEKESLFARESTLQEKFDNNINSAEDDAELKKINKTIETLDKSNGLLTQIKELKRELHALKNPNWVLMKDVLAKAGVQAKNKKAVKNNVVYSLTEFGALLDRFTGEQYTMKDNDLLDAYEEKTQELMNLQDNNEEMVNMRKRLNELKMLYDGTHINFGNPSEEDEEFDKKVRKLNYNGNRVIREVEHVELKDLNSEKLFRGNKGKVLDAFIKEQMAKCPNYAKFRWYEGFDTTYGATYHINSKQNATDWFNIHKEEFDKGTLKYEPGVSNADCEGYIELHIHKARSMPVEITKLVLLHEIAHARAGDLTGYLEWFAMDDDWNLVLDNGNLKPTKRKNGEKYKKARGTISHNRIWQAVADELFDENFEGIFGRPYDSETDAWLRPAPTNTFYTWSRVFKVLRFKTDKIIRGAFYNQGDIEFWLKTDNIRQDEEIVNYNPDEYGDKHYKQIDRYEFRKRQKEDASKIMEEISQLNQRLVLNSTSERRTLERELDQIKKKIVNRDFKVFVKLAEYFRKKINKQTVLRDMAHLYSAKTLATFKKDFIKIIKKVEDEYEETIKHINEKDIGIELPLVWESQWFEKGESNTKIIRKTFHDYMGAFIAVCYTTDSCTPENFKAKTGTERTNGIPLALRYAMTRDDVHVSKLNVTSFEKLKKFKRTDGTYDTQFLFAKKGTKQQGVYDNTGITMDEPTNKKGYEEFHEKAANILENWTPARPYSEEQVPKKTKKKKVKETSISRPLKSGKMPKGTPSRMDIYLDRLELEKVGVDKDGNCFFHALQKTAGLNKVSIQDLRTAIVNRLLEIEDEPVNNDTPDFKIQNLMYREQESGRLTVVNSTNGRNAFDTVGEYLNAMMEDKSWADIAVVTAAMVYLNRPIFIVTNKSNPEYGFMVYEFPESLKKGKLGDPIVLTLNDGDSGGGNHYEATRIKHDADVGETIDNIKGEPKTKALSNILAIIKRASKMKPTSVPRQSGLTCGMHAINNLMGTAYTAEDLTAVCKDNKTENWNQEVIMHFLGVKYGKNDSQSLTMQFDAASVKEMRTMTQFLSFDGLLGFVLHSPGHWTAMRRWDTSVESGFSYMDSLPSQARNRLRTFKTARDMADYLLTSIIEDVEPGDDTYNIYPVFLSPQNKIAFDKSGILRTGKKTTTDPGKVVDLSEDEPNEEHELIIFYANLIIRLGALITLKGVQKRGKLYDALREKINEDLKTIAGIVKREAGLTQSIDELIKFALGAKLEQKKTWLELYVKKL